MQHISVEIISPDPKMLGGIACHTVRQPPKRLTLDMLAPYEHGNPLDAMPDESVSLDILVRSKQLLITKDPHLVLHVTPHAVHLVSSSYHAFLS